MLVVLVDLNVRYLCPTMSSASPERFSTRILVVVVVVPRPVIVQAIDIRLPDVIIENLERAVIGYCARRNKKGIRQSA